MNWIGTVFLAMFASNALLSWGFGLKSGFGSERGRPRYWIVYLLGLNLVASVLLWLVSTFVLVPLGIGHLVVIVYSLLIVPLLRLISRGIGSAAAAPTSPSLAVLDELSLSNLVFGISLVSVRGASSLVECIVAAMASVFGWWCAAGLLGAIERRTEAGSASTAIKGSPSLLLSAALIAMTLSLAGVALGQGVGK